VGGGKGRAEGKTRMEVFVVRSRGLCGREMGNGEREGYWEGEERRGRSRKGVSWKEMGRGGRRW